MLLGSFTLLRSVGGEPGVTGFPFETREGLLWVQVCVPETPRKLEFLLDSGAEASVIDLHTAKEIGLALGAPVPVRGVHASTQGHWCGAISARASGLALPNRFLALDLASLSGSCGRKVDGLIGADFFRNKVVQIDFSREKVHLLNPKTVRGAGAMLPLEVRRCGMRAAISVEGQKPRWFRIDTGCASALQCVTGQVDATACSPKIAVGLAEVAIPQTRTTVKIGGETLHGVETGLHKTEIFPGEAGLIGNGLLKQFGTITIDAVEGKLILGARPPGQS
jgi:hypothetical protein